MTRTVRLNPTLRRFPWLAAAAIVATTLIPQGDVEAQQRTQAGPVIESGGAVFRVAPTLPTPVERDYRLAFDVSAPAPSVERVNAAFNTAARFLNMHAQAGVPVERLSAALVVHGGASLELLDDEAYRERFGTANPNAPLLREMMEKGHRVILCGQSAASRDVPTDRLVEGVEVALSAMTAFLLLQDEGYRVNPW